MKDERKNALNHPLALRAHQVAKLLNVSLRTVRAWTKQNQIPHLRVGEGKRPMVIYPLSALQGWLDRRGQEPGRESLLAERG
jgi:excisionase family DNA binding protein